ncbi:MAG: ligase-associated DNA damage response endonuclease PdeM [Betaproteobacteria bacterium]|nr:ligase-associated DNA damage response endonuclease PdeM [Betaproteobacteria bacterium]PWB58120.1 MAG: DEAD/DEAH box helicase [Betaproteobacteria bacterium]
MTECVVAGERLVLLAQRAAWWPARETLFVADFHLGKAASFRRAGIALPAGTTTENVERLERALEARAAAHLVFLGDFLHSAEGRAPATLERFARWRAARPGLAITLVRGNHDDRAGDPPAEWDIRCVNPGEALGPFALVHEPAPVRGGYALAGHVHPAVRLAERGGQSLRLPCFWFGPRVGVLPSFGAFTGSALVRPRAGDQVFVVADDEVIRV